MGRYDSICEKMSPFVSVIIPAYNSWEKLGELLKSLEKSTFANFEIIVGDDGSENYNNYKSYNNYNDYKIVRLKRNRGPAAARNAAAHLARGRVLVFLDSDVTVYPDTLGVIAKKFMDDRDLTALTGVWDKHQKTRSFFPQFKAMRDWSYWINERDVDGYYYLFSTRIAAIKRDVFNRLGGFNESFRQMEDVEITYRIARRYAIIFAPDVRVHHEFEGFWPVARKYFWRSFYWSRLWQARRKFDPVATTFWETLAAISGVGVIGAIGAIGVLGEIGVILAIGLLLIHVFLLRKFLRFVWKEKGFAFMLKALVTGIVLYCIIAAGALYYHSKIKL